MTARFDDGERNDKRHPHEAAVKQALRDDAHAIFAMRENPQVEQRFRYCALARYEQSHTRDAHKHRRPHKRFDEPHIGSSRKAEQQSAKAEGRKGKRGNIEMGGGVFDLALPNDDKRANDQQSRRTRQDKKHRTPAERRAQRATDDRADIGCKPKGDAGNAHGRPVTILWEARHGDRLQQRHEHAGTQRFEHTADNEHREVDREAVAQRPDEIETVRVQDKGANRQLPLQI